MEFIIPPSLSEALLILINLVNEFEFSRGDGTVLRFGEFGTLGSLSGGIGYKYLDKFSLELRLLTISNRAILFSDSEFDGLSIIFGYTLF